MEPRNSKSKKGNWKENYSWASCARKQYIESEREIYKKLYEELMNKNNCMEKQLNSLQKENKHLKR